MSAVVTEEQILRRLNPFDPTSNGLDGIGLPSNFSDSAERLAAQLGGAIQHQRVNYTPAAVQLTGRLPLENRMKILFVGFNNLAERFGMQALGNLKELNPTLKVEITAIDTYSLTDEVTNMRGRTLSRDEWIEDLEFMAGAHIHYCPASDFWNRSHDKQFDVVYIATTPTSHFDVLDEVTSRLKPAQVKLIAVEKPFVDVAHVGAMRGLLLSSSHRVTDIDFFNQAQSFLWLVESPQGREILERFGSPVVINGNCVEVFKEWRDWLFDETASGGGVFFDCGSHTINGNYLLQSHLHSHGNGNGTSTASKPTIHSLLFGEYHLQPHLRETYALVQSTLDGVVWNLQSGKALPETAYNFEAFNARGDYLLMSVGTETHPPYVLHAEDKSTPTLYTFTARGVGYEQVFGRLFQMAYNIDPSPVPDPETSMRASLDLVTRLEEEGRTHPSASRRVHYDTRERTEDLVWPDPDVYLPVTQDAFGALRTKNVRRR